ncbi:MAG: phosphatidylserine decarboxylase family protein [Flavobacteriales bacterium]
MRIHKEGRGILIKLLAILTALNVVTFTFSAGELLQTLTLVASLIIFILVLQFFRHPSRKIRKNDDIALAPADGTIVAIEEIHENEFYHDSRLLISIFMSPLNVHVNRFAISGEVKYFKYHEGLYLVASHPKSSTENERTTVVVQGNKNQSVLMRQISGYVARRIVTYCRVGDKAEQGSEFGFIKFGSRVDVILPKDVKPLVSMQQKVKGGITALAKFA